MNPEIQRYLWTDISVTRLVVPPALILFVAVALHSGGEATDAPLRILPGLLVVFAGLLWGAERALDSFFAEVRERTWDFQRVSAMTPVAMTFGKLVGGTLYNWYVAGLGLVWFGVESLNQGFPLGTVVQQITIACFAMITVQAAALMGALASGPERVAGQSSIRVLGVFAAFLVLPLGIGFIDNDYGMLPWWGATVHALDFLLLSSIGFAAWAVLGCQRNMSEQLSVAQRPWALLAFIVYAGIWLEGLSPTIGGDASSAAGALSRITLLALIMAYGAMLKGPIDVDAILRPLYFARHGNVERMLQSLPLWCVILPALLGLSVMMAGARLADGATGAALLPQGPAWYPVLALLATRDALLLLWLHAGPRRQRAYTSWFILLVLLHGVLPGVLISTQLDGLRQLLQPASPDSAALGAIAVALGHVAVVGGLLWRRLR